MRVMARETWTDERLDDLTKHMDENFQELRADLRQQREETAAEFAVLRRQITSESTFLQKELGEVREGLGELRAEVKGLGEKMDVRFDDLNRTLQIAFSLIGVVLAGLMGLIGTQL